MLLSGRPLLDTRADATLFVDGAELLPRLSAACASGLNVLLSGARGAGKTSVLRQLLFSRRRAGTETTALVSVGMAGSPAEALTMVQRGLAPDLAAASTQGAPQAADVLAALAQMDTPADTVILLDNLPPGLAHAIFGQLRDELWQLPLVWVIACADSDEGLFLRPPADAFFDSVVRVPPLTDNALRDLLRRRASRDELDDSVLTSVVELAEGNPRAALNLTRQLTGPDASPERLHDRLANRRQALAGLGRPAEMLFAELLTSGGASASDEALLSRLGWTRGRAAQVLEQLASAGLVEAVDVRNGPGRPRRVYRPVHAETPGPSAKAAIDTRHVKDR